MATLSGLTANLFGRTALLYNWPIAIVGKDSSGNPVPLKLSDDGTITATVSGAGTQRTQTITLLTTSGTIAAGARGLTLIFSTDFTGTVGGVAFNGANDSSFTFPIPSGDTIGAVSYVVTTGSIRAVKVV